MDLSDAELERVMRALVHYRAPGEAAQTLELLGRVHREILRRRVLAQELGPATGERTLVPIPGGGSR